LLRLPRGDDGRFPPIPVIIVVVGGGYFLMHSDVLVGYFERVVTFRRGCRLLGASPLPFFPAKLYSFEFDGLYNWVILLLGLCHLFLGRSLVQWPSYFTIIPDKLPVIASETQESP
jgi:hypothetical protein